MIKGVPEEIGMEAKAKIVWGNNNGVALKFTSMTFTNYKLLQKTLMAEAAEPLELLKEFPIMAPFDITRLQQNFGGSFAQTKLFVV